MMCHGFEGEIKSSTKTCWGSPQNDFLDKTPPIECANPPTAELIVSRTGRAKKSPTKRRSRAVLTKEQAIEVYEQKLANEATSAAADARAAANAAVVSRR